jgi:hypothetical protein
MDVVKGLKPKDDGIGVVAGSCPTERRSVGTL